MSLVATSRVYSCGYIQASGLSHWPLFSFSSHIRANVYAIFFVLFQLSISLPFYSFPSSVMSNIANDAQVASVAPSSRDENTSQVSDRDSAAGTRVVGIEVDRGFPSWSAAEFMTRNADTLGVQQFRAMFSDGAYLFVFDQRNARCDMDFGTLPRQWKYFFCILWRWCQGKLRDVLGFDIATVRHAQEVSRLRCLLRVSRNFDVTSEGLGLDLCCFEDLVDRSYLVTDADAWWSELDVEVQKRYHGRGLRFLGWHSLKIFPLPPSEGNDFYTQVPNGWDL